MLAAWQLRPIFRRQDGGGGSAVPRGLRAILSSRRRWRFRRRPILGNRPMLWKELHTGGARGLARFVGFLLTLIGGGFLAFYTVWFGGLAVPGVVGFMATSHRWDYSTRNDRVGVLLVPRVRRALALPGGHSDDSRGGGRGDHLGARGRHLGQLDGTDLTGREIIFAKLLGAMRRGRQLAELILMLAVAGVVAGSIHALRAIS